MSDTQQLERLFDQWIRAVKAGTILDLQELCRDAPELLDALRQRIEKLEATEVYAESKALDGASPVDPAATEDFAKTETKVRSHATAKNRHAKTFGDYDLLEELGRGGMGVVYKARQRKAGRLVALKVIRPDKVAGLNESEYEQAIERFLTEARAAAGLSHDHIVPVYDVGEVEGRPYYSMHFVDGQSLADTLRDGPLSPVEIAGYLKPICMATQFAHDKGVLHRDLKPQNILIDSASDRAQITDFGLAKLIEAGATVTRVGDRFGSPPYMSPEQAEDATQTSAFSDVYSLGAVLYECLTGRPPFRAATPQATLYQVVHVEPASPRAINPDANRDLETIALRCLEKEPQRRYASAGEVADELRRFLRGEPIQARPSGAIKKAWRWCRCNKLVASLLGLLAVALTSVAVVSAIAAYAINQNRLRLKSAFASAQEHEARASLARDEKERQRQLAVQSQQLAEQAAVEAEQSAVQAQALLDLLQESFANPDPARDGRLVTVAESLQSTLERLEHDTVIPDAVKAKLLVSVGQTFVSLGLPRRAVDVLQQGVELLTATAGADALETLLAKNSLATALKDAGRIDEALPLAIEATDDVTQKFGRDHPETLALMGNLAVIQLEAGNTAEATQLFETVRQFNERLADPLDVNWQRIQLNLAAAYQLSGRYDEAEALLEQTVAIMTFEPGTDHPVTLAAMGNLVATLRQNGQPKRALALARQVAMLADDALGENHHTTLWAEKELVEVLTQTRQLVEARNTSAALLASATDALGPDHPLTARVRMQQALLFQLEGKLNEAAEAYEQVIPLLQQVFGEDHPDTLTTQVNLVTLHAELRRQDDAISLAEAIEPKLVRVLGRTHPFTLKARYNLAVIYAQVNQREKSQRLHDDILSIRQSILRDGHPDLYDSMNSVGVGHLFSGEGEQARKMLEPVWKWRQQQFGDADFRTIIARQNLAEAYWQLKDRLRAIGHARQAAQALAAYPNPSPLITGSLRGAAKALLKYGAVENAETAARACLDFAKGFGGQYPSEMARSLDMLAEVLLAADKQDEAVEIAKQLVAIFADPSSQIGAIVKSRDTLARAYIQAENVQQADDLLESTVNELHRRREQGESVPSLGVLPSIKLLIEFYESNDQPDEANKWKQRVNP